MSKHGSALNCCYGSLPSGRGHVDPSTRLGVMVEWMTDTTRGLQVMTASECARMFAIEDSLLLSGRTPKEK